MMANTAHATGATKGFAKCVNETTIVPMYKRSIKPIQEFLEANPNRGGYIIDTQFGKINYVSGEVAPVISTRINANAAYYVIEVE